MGYDGSPAAAAALARAADATASCGRLTLAYIHDVRSSMLACAAAAPDVFPIDGDKLGARILLDGIGRLPEGLPATWLVRQGRVGRQLAHVAQEQRCSAIVIGGAADRRMRIRLFPSVLRQLQAWTDLPIIEAKRDGGLTRSA